MGRLRPLGIPHTCRMTVEACPAQHDGRSCSLRSVRRFGADPLVEFFLPFPPSVNSIWRSARKAVYRSPKYLAWRERAAHAVRGVWRGQPIRETVSIEIRVYGDSRRSWDLDNRCKAVLDLLQDEGVIEDDNQVHHLVLHRGPKRRGGGAWVRLQIMDPETAPPWPDHAST